MKEGGGGAQNTCRGGTVQNSFMNSPIAITVVPGETSPTETFATVPPTVADGETTFLVTLDLRDNFGNPTTLQTVEADTDIREDDDDDVLEYFWDNNGDTRSTITNTTMTISKTTEGTSLLYIELNGLAIRGSPFAVTTEKVLNPLPGIASIVLIFGSTIAALQLVFFILIQFVLTEKKYIKRQSRAHLLAAVYSGLDWFLDVYFANEAFARGFIVHAKVGLGILMANIVINTLAMVHLIAKEKNRQNVDKEAWKKSGYFVGLVEFFAMNNIGLLKVRYG